MLPPLQINLRNVDLEEDDEDEQSNERTVLVNHQPGWTIFENLYLYNGTLYSVT